MVKFVSQLGDMKSLQPLVLAAAILSFTPLFGQEIVFIEAEDNFSFESCESPVQFSLSEYTDGALQSIDIARGESIEGDLILVINPIYFNQIWDIDAASQLWIYSGTEGNLDLYGSFNSADQADGFIVTTTEPLIRLEFEGGGTGAGFDLLAYCAEAYEELPALRVEIETDGTPWYFNSETQAIEAGACEDQEFTLGIDLVPLEIGGQVPDSVNFKWWMGDSTIYQGIDLYAITHTYADGPGRIISIWYWENGGEANSYKSVVKLSERPEFNIDAPNEELCLNGLFEFIGGVADGEIIGATSGTEGTVEITEFYGNPQFLPDGNAQPYQTTVEVSGFDEGTVIDDQTSLKAFCLNIEHSYLGDLETWITCPNGQTALLFDGFNGPGLYPGDGFGGGGTFLGNANDNIWMEPGFGFNYCFSDDGELQTMEEEFFDGNTISVDSFLVGGNAMVSGTYLPEESFIESFEGCPVNGDWILTSADNIFADNGYIFEWYMSFETQITPEIYEYQIDLVDASWADNPGINPLTETSILYSAYSISPENPQFVAIDNVGCTYIEEIEISVRDTAATFTELGVCSGYVLPWLAENGEITILSGDNSAIEFEEENGFYKINSSSEGFFEFSFEDFECPYSATAELEFLAPDNPACLTSSQIMKFSPNLTLIPNPARGESRLKFELHHSEELNLTIVSPGGKIIQNKVLQGVQGSNSFLLHLQELASGYYLITLKGESVQSTARLIVN